MLLLSLGCAGGCLLQLEGAVACGDGYVDRQAGEECDPQNLASYLSACSGTARPFGVGACDPTSCTIIDDLQQCGVCGDSFVDEALGEACDGSNLAGQTCPSRAGVLRCDARCQLDTSQCRSCGNGILDEGEECEPSSFGEFGIPRACAGNPAEGVEPLASPFPNLPYASGVATLCTSSCTYSRIGCSYCGNGVLDEMTLLDTVYMTFDEWCDGDQFDADELQSQEGVTCSTLGSGLRPNVGCGDDCRSFVDREGGACCRVKGERCPLPNEAFDCCYAYDHPEDPSSCETISTTQGAWDLCK